MPPPSLNTGYPLVLEIDDLEAVCPDLLDQWVHPSRVLPTGLQGAPVTPPGGRRACAERVRSRAFLGHAFPRRAQGRRYGAGLHRGDRAAASMTRRRRTQRRSPGRQAFDRLTTAVVCLCTLVGVWLGVDAPASSPVAASALTSVSHSVA